MSHPTLIQVSAVGVAGFAGAVSRYLLDHYATSWLGSPRFPVGTLIINISASFLLGAAMTWFDRHGHKLEPWVIPAVTTGFIGTYSTFSTYMWQVHKSLTLGEWAIGAAYLVTSIVAGLAAVVAGVWAAKGL